uniref:Uncharacterized protein n=1 Tax=Oryza brachyantha TaxID=4533 RepID=J3M632_ORYBR
MDELQDLSPWPKPSRGFRIQTVLVFWRSSSRQTQCSTVCDTVIDAAMLVLSSLSHAIEQKKKKIAFFFLLEIDCDGHALPPCASLLIISSCLLPQFGGSSCRHLTTDSNAHYIYSLHISVLQTIIVMTGTIIELLLSFLALCMHQTNWLRRGDILQFFSLCYYIVSACVFSIGI